MPFDSEKNRTVMKNGNNYKSLKKICAKAKTSAFGCVKIIAI